MQYHLLISFYNYCDTVDQEGCHRSHDKEQLDCREHLSWTLDVQTYVCGYEHEDRFRGGSRTIVAGPKKYAFAWV